MVLMLKDDCCDKRWKNEWKNGSITFSEYQKLDNKKKYLNFGTKYCYAFWKKKLFSAVDLLLNTKIKKGWRKKKYEKKRKYVGISKGKE